MSRMLKFSLWLLVVLAMSLSQVGCVTPLPEAKDRVIRYYEDGSYERAVAAKLREASKLLPQPGSYNAVGSAVIMDIDDTVLSTYEYQKSLDFGHYGPAWHKWLALGRAPVIRPSLAFYLLAQERGLAVFFITGRREQFRAVTEENLRAAGFHGWKGLFMKPTDWNGKSVSDFKVAQRITIENMGYKIIMNVGDNPSDLEGGHSARTLLLPNLMYRVR